MTEPHPAQKAALIVEAALERKAEAPVVLDMRNLTAYADSFIILSGRSDRQVRSIADAIVQALKEIGEQPLGVEGLDEGHWVLIDCNDAIVHVFDPETREKYDLERLWQDAPRLSLSTDLGIEDVGSGPPSSAEDPKRDGTTEKIAEPAA